MSRRAAAVLVDQSPQAVSSCDYCGAAGGSGPGPPEGTTQFETAVRSLGVVMVHVVAKHGLEMAPSPDEQVIEARLANGPQPALGTGVGLRRPLGRADHPASLPA